MLDPAHKHLMYVLYDSVTNSVFQSVVLAPLLSRLARTPDLEITLVSFERKEIPAQVLMRIIPAHDRLHFIVLKRLPFFGRLSLWVGGWQLYCLFGKIPCHEIVARGPLAGWIALFAVRKLTRKYLKQGAHSKALQTPPLMVQARGLCAEEFRYAKIKERFPLWKSFYYVYMYKILKLVERAVYRKRESGDIPRNILIESVSPALRDYLVKTFRAQRSSFVIAQDDYPAIIPAEQVAQWRATIRQQLEIAPDAYVYCYSGSYKPWQCSEEMIQFFSKQLTVDPTCMLLIYSQDKEDFIHIIEQSSLPPQSYRVMSVAQRHLLEYLSAADAGLLFREPDIINWVSRPTKVLEYQAVGLKIVHNNTVAWLAEQEQIK